MEEISIESSRPEESHLPEMAEAPSEEGAAEASIPKKEFPKEDTLFDHAMPTNGALTLSVYGDVSVVSRTIYDKSTREALLEELLKVEAKREEEWTPELAALPVCIIQVWGADGRLTEAAWSDGYWFSPNGVPYRFDYDFEKLIAAYDWEEKRESDSEGMLLLWEGAGREGWFPYVLWQADELPVPLQGISAEAVSMEDNVLTIEITNNTEEAWLYGEFFTLDVLTDGTWYDMVTIPDAWGFDDYALGLAAGESLEKEYDFTMHYGVLPEGTYRLCIESDKLTVVFSVEADREL